MKAHLSNTQTLPLLARNELSAEVQSWFDYAPKCALFFHYAGQWYATSDMIETTPDVLTVDELLTKQGQHLYEPANDSYSSGVCAEYSPCGDAVKVSRYTIVRDRVVVWCLERSDGQTEKFSVRDEFLQLVDELVERGDGFDYYGLNTALERVEITMEGVAR